MSILSRLATRYMQKSAALFKDQGSNPKVAKAIKAAERKVKAKQIPNVKRLTPFTVIENPEGLETGLVEWNKDVLEIDTSSRGLSQGGPGGKLSYELYLLIAVGDKYMNEVIKGQKKREWLKLVQNQMSAYNAFTRVPPTQIKNVFKQAFAYSFAHYVLDTLPTELEYPFESFLGVARKRDEVETGSLGIVLDPNRYDKIKGNWGARGATNFEEAKEIIAKKLNEVFPDAKHNLGRPLKAEDIYDMVGASAIPNGMELSITMKDDSISVSGSGENVDYFLRTIGFNGVITNRTLVFNSQKYDEYGDPTDHEGNPLEEVFEQSLPDDIEPSEMIEVITNNDLLWDLETQLENLGMDFSDEDLEDYLERIDIDTDTSDKAERVRKNLRIFITNEIPLDDPEHLDEGESYYRDATGALWNGDGTLIKGMPKGTGSKLFAAQVQAAQKIGMKRIECLAAKGPEYVGYKVWYKLGYDGLVGGAYEDGYIPEQYSTPVNERAIATLDRETMLVIIKEHLDYDVVGKIEEHLDYEPDVYDAEEEAKALYNSGEWETKLSDEFFRQTITEMAESGDYDLEEWGIGPRWSLQALMAEGLDYEWDEVGFSWDASFDLSRYSRSMEILENYVKRKSGGDVNNWFHKVSQVSEDGVTQAGGTFDADELRVLDEIYREFTATTPLPTAKDMIKLVRDLS